MRVLLQESHKTGDTWKHLKDSPDLANPQQLIEMIGLTEEHFFESAQARGLITTALQQQFTNHHPLTILYTMDCYMQSVYKHVWKQRNIALIHQDREINAYQEALIRNRAELENEPIQFIKLKRTGNIVTITTPRINQHRVQKKLKTQHGATHQTRPKRTPIPIIKFKRTLKLTLFTHANKLPTLKVARFIALTTPQATPRLKKRKKPPDKHAQNSYKRIKGPDSGIVKGMG
jgi:hypothetical protein